MVYYSTCHLKLVKKIVYMIQIDIYVIYMYVCVYFAVYILFVINNFFS